MTQLPRIGCDELAAVVREDIEHALRKIVQSVNDAAAGELISGSEEFVRDAVGDLRTCLFQKALQLRVDAIEKQLPRPVETLSSKNKRHKGRQSTSILTINGRVSLSRTWWHSSVEGSSAPLDLIIRADGATTTPGVREMACRVNNHSSSFATAAQNLQRTAQVTLCDESLRRIVLKEGQRVQADQRSGRLVPSFTAEDCRIDKTPIREHANAHPTASPTTTPAAPIAVSVEAGSVEAGTVESGTVESGTVESGTVESGTVESGTVEAESVEAESVGLIILSAARCVGRTILSLFTETQTGLSVLLAESAIKDESVASEPVASEPVASEPVASEPVASESVASEPVASESVASESVESESVASESVESESVASESVASEPVAPHLVASESAPSERESSSATVSVRRMYCGVDGVMVPTITDTEKKKRRQGQVKKRRDRATNDPTWKARQKTLPRRKTGTDSAYKEFKLLAFYDESNRHKHLILSRARRPEVGGLLKQIAGHLKFADCEEKIANVDGAVWIPGQIEVGGLDVDGLGLDFFHLSEHVHAAKRAVFGESSVVGDQWVSTRLHEFKHSGYDATVASLSEWKSPLRGGRRKAATKLLNYVTDRRGMIQYPEFIAEGWQIGSGPTESGCRTSTRRLKVSGARWDMINAESVASLVNLQDSNQWHHHWPNLRPVTT